MTSNIADREELADEEFEQYDFGDGARVVQHDRWNTDDIDDLNKILYVQFDDEPPDADSYRLSFHVRFDEAGQVDDAYALSMDSGADVGERRVKPGMADKPAG